MQSYGTPSLGIRAVKRINDLSIGWIAPLDFKAAQTRIRVLNIHRRLTSIGWYSKVIDFSAAINNKFDIVIVGKEFSQYALNSIKEIKKRHGSYIICDLCEDLFSIFENTNPNCFLEILNISDKVICASDRLTSEVFRKIEHGNVETIEDAYESDPILNCRYIDDPESKLKVVYFGYGGNAYLAEQLEEQINSLNMELVTITEWDTATIKWKEDTWIQELLKCDIVIIPQRVHDQPCKSNNKLTQAMALGFPVVASDLPAYEKFTNFKKATNTNEFINHLSSLKTWDKRYELGIAAKKEVINKYSIASIAEQWISIFTKIQNSVDILIVSYNNKRYLLQTIRSIKDSTTYPYKIIVIDSGNQQLNTEETKGFLYKYFDKKLSFAQANNEGIKLCSSKYVCFLNNDIITTFNWLENLVDGLSHFDIVGPLSNCDKGWLNNITITVTDEIELVPNMTIEDFDKHPVYKDPVWYICDVEGVNEYHSRDWIAFYCVLISRENLLKVGYLDDYSFVNNAEDVDFCIRAKKLGLTVGQNYNSYVFHFGGKTRKISEIENADQHEIDDKQSSHALKAKYEKQLFVIWNGPSFKPWDDRNLELGNVAGSEIWTINLAREMDKLGYRVVVFNDCPNRYKKFGDIEYWHWTEFGDWNDRNFIDYFISSRSLEPFKLPRLRASEKYVMIHDIWIMLNHKDDIQYKDRVDKFFCLSNRHRDFVSEWHGITKDRILMTSNGVTFVGKEAERNKYKVLYTSSPDRGLENLLDIWPKLIKEIPQLELHIYYGFNWVKDQDWVSRMMDKIGSYDNVHYHGKVNQNELHEAYSTSRLVLAPNHFWETFCISAVEAMMSGCVYVGSNIWGLKDTVKDAQPLIEMKNEENWNTSEEYRKLFIEEVVKLVNNDRYFKKWQKRGKERAVRYTWGSVSAQFDQYFKNKIWNEIQ